MALYMFDIDLPDNEYLKRIYCCEKRKYTSAKCELVKGHEKNNEPHMGRDTYGRYHCWKLPIKQLSLFE